MLDHHKWLGVQICCKELWVSNIKFYIAYLFFVTQNKSDMHNASCAKQSDGFMTNVLLSKAYQALDDFGYPIQAFGFIAPKNLNYLAFQSFDFDRT